MYNSTSGMEDNGDACDFSLNNACSETIRTVIDNSSNAHRYIYIEPLATYSLTLNKNDETVINVFTDESPRGKYDASWSITPGHTHIHCKVERINGEFTLKPNRSRKPNISRHNIKKILTKKATNN